MNYCILCEDVEIDERSEEHENNWRDYDDGPYCIPCFTMLNSSHMVLECEELCKYTDAEGNLIKTEWKPSTIPFRALKLDGDNFHFYSDYESVNEVYWTSSDMIRFRSLSHYPVAPTTKENPK